MTKHLLCCFGLLLLAAPAMAQQVGIAAIVNDEVITSSDVSDRRDFIMATSDVPPTAAAQKALTPKILEALISETLELQEAKRSSIEVDDKEIEAAIAKIEQARKRPPGSLREFIKTNGLSEKTMETQIRAQIAWNKVIERKLRRGVNIAQDEVARAQVAEASAPGTPQVRIAAISIPVRSAEEEKTATELVGSLSSQLNDGTDFMTLAQQVADKGTATLSAPVWASEETLQPGIQQALRSLQPGQVTQPLRSQNSYQLIALLERRISKPTPDATEAVVKQFTIPLPEKKDPASMAAAKEITNTLRNNPGSCMDTNMGDLTGKASAEFIRATYKQMSPDLRGVVEHLGVTEVSEPLLTPTAVMLVMPCERIEPSTSLPDADVVRNRLYSEKLELEAQKTLRNLKRDAFIDIKGE